MTDQQKIEQAEVEGQRLRANEDAEATTEDDPEVEGQMARRANEDAQATTDDHPEVEGQLPRR